MSPSVSHGGGSWESVRLLIAGQRGPGGIPSPVADPRDRYRLWRSSEVQQWFAEHYGEESVCADAHTVAAINAELELRGSAEAMLPTGSCAIPSERLPPLFQLVN